MPKVTNSQIKTSNVSNSSNLSDFCGEFQNPSSIFFRVRGVPTLVTKLLGFVTWRCRKCRTIKLLRKLHVPKWVEFRSKRAISAFQNNVPRFQFSKSMPSKGRTPLSQLGRTSPQRFLAGVNVLSRVALILRPENVLSTGVLCRTSISVACDKRCYAPKTSCAAHTDTNPVEFTGLRSDWRMSCRCCPASSIARRWPI